MASNSIRRAAPVAVLLLAFAGSAHGQEATASDRETARGLMQEGDARRDRKDLRGALESYQAADAIMHVTSTGLAVGRVMADLGQLVEAREKLIEVARIPARAGEPAALAESRAAAQTLSDELEARIPGLKIILHGVPEGATAAVTVDGGNIPQAALIAYRKVNPGRHVIVARAGSAEKREEVTLREREKREAILDLAVSPPPVQGPPAAQTQESSTPQTGDTTPASPGPWKTLMWVGFGVGVVGIATGAITGLISISNTNAAKAIPPDQGGCNAQNQCGPATFSDIDTANTTGTISTIAFAVGGAGVVLGVVSLVLAGKSGATASASALAPEPPRPHVTPWLGPGTAGLIGSF